jgi:hypothetical protein
MNSHPSRIPHSRTPWHRRDHPSILVAALVAYFILSPLLDAEARTFLASVAVTLLVFSSALVVLHRRALVATISSIGVPLCALQWLSYLGLLTRGFEVPRVILFLAFLGTLLGAQVALILEERRVSRETVLRALGAYILLGCIWSGLYRIVVAISPEAIQGLTEGSPLSDFMYFSFVCLTTVGFGDIVPIAPIARNLTIAEAVVGQIYLATVIAKLVSMHGSERLRGGSEE